MSAHELITDHLDLWTGAVTQKRSGGRGNNGKIELTGIKKLRELILELAVRGKLVEQDPDDEPASVLLERIAEEKARLVKEGKIKKPRKLPAITEEEMPFELPEGWEWARIWDISELITSGSRDWAKNYSEDGAIFITMGNLSRGDYQLRLDNIRYVSPPPGGEGVRTSLQAGDLVISITGDVGNLGLIPEGFGEAYINQHSCLVRFSSLCRNRYHAEFLRSPSAKAQFDEPQRGVKNSFRLSDMGEMLIPLPPESEQQRIVEKVDELMSLCDRLEQQVGDQLEAHEMLVDTLLDALARSADAAEVAENWARIAEHFDTLFTTEASIDKLKQTILQLAVMGRLVEQDPDDEPASVLLERIAEEKARLVKEGKIKRSKSPPPVRNEERSYANHENWAWVRFQDIANEISTGPFGSMIHKHDYVAGGVPLINPSHMINGKIQEDRTVSVSAHKTEELSSYKLNSGDIVMARRGEVGRCAIATDRESGWLCGTGSFVLRLHEDISRRYILMMFSTDSVRGYLTGNSVGTTMTNLNHGILNKMPISLPPKDEQHRIVEKVDELMALCDHLKVRLGEAGETRAHLAEAVVEKAVTT